MDGVGCEGCKTASARQRIPNDGDVTKRRQIGTKRYGINRLAANIGHSAISHFYFPGVYLGAVRHAAARVISHHSLPLADLAGTTAPDRGIPCVYYILIGQLAPTLKAGRFECLLLDRRSDGASGLRGMSAVGEPALERHGRYVVEDLGNARGHFRHLKLPHSRRIHEPAASLRTRAKAVHLTDGSRVKAFAVTFSYSLRQDAVGPFQCVDES
jgi:hypothetical protein